MSQADIRRKLAVECLCSPSNCFEDCPACSQLYPEEPCLAEGDDDGQNG